MARRSPARWLAPLALVLFTLALVSVVGGGSPDTTESANPTTAPAATTTSGEDAGSEETAQEGGSRKRYTVKLGDTPSQIAADNDITLEQLQKLNPDLDPQLLEPGEKIRIRK